MFLVADIDADSTIIPKTLHKAQNEKLPAYKAYVVVATDASYAF